MADESNAGTNGLASGGDKADPATVFAALAEIIYQGSDAKEMYAAICVAATGPTGEIGVSTVRVLEREPAGQGARWPAGAGSRRNVV